MEIFTDSVAATITILGMVMYFNGATHAFPITKLQWTCPLLSTAHKYVT